MRYILYDAAGRQWELPAPVSVSLQKDEIAPATGFKAVFPVKDTLPCAAFLRMENSKNLWFNGIVDTLTQTDGTTQLLTVTARSKAALLLDSEALPSLYRTPSLPELAHSHAVPYGFTGICGCTDSFTMPYTIEKGISEWQVLADFCQQYLGASLREENGVLTAEPPVYAVPICFGKTGIPYLQVCRKRNFYRGFSEIWGQSSGFWEKQAEDVFVQKLGILRCKRSEHAEALLAAAQEAMFSVTVLCAGWQQAQIGQPAVLELQGETLRLRVKQILYSLSAKGKTTRFVLGADREEENKCGC